MPRSAQGAVATLSRTIYQQPAAEDVWAQHPRIVEQLLPRFPQGRDPAAGRCLRHPRLQRVSAAALGADLVQQPAERLNKKIRRRTDVVGIFPAGHPTPRRFTDDSVQGILTNPFYVGFCCQAGPNQAGDSHVKGASSRCTSAGCVSGGIQQGPIDSPCPLQSPRSVSSKLRPYLVKGLLRCATCGEKVWCQHIKSLNYYRESSASRGIACVRAGRYWPAPAVDHQIDGLVKPLELPVSRQERAFELANADSSLSTACEPRHRPKRPSSSCPSMISGASARTGNWPLPRRSTKC